MAMRHTRNYGCIMSAVKANGIEFYTRGLEADYKRFCKQAKRWLRERGTEEAEQRFLLNYVPGAVVIPLDERGLTQGMVFTYKGKLYWDEGYQIIGFLEKLIEGGSVYIRCTGKANDKE